MYSFIKYLPPLFFLFSIFWAASASNAKLPCLNLWCFLFLDFSASLSNFLGDLVSQLLKCKHFAIFNSEIFSHSSVNLFWTPCFYFVSVVSFPRASEHYGGNFSCSAWGLHVPPSECLSSVAFGICPLVINFPQGLVMLSSFLLRRKVPRTFGCFLFIVG